MVCVKLTLHFLYEVMVSRHIFVVVEVGWCVLRVAVENQDSKLEDHVEGKM